MIGTIFLTLRREESIPSGSVHVKLVSIEYNDIMGPNIIELHWRQESRKQINPVHYKSIWTLFLSKKRISIYSIFDQGTFSRN